MLKQQRNVVDALRDDRRYRMHPQSLTQSGLYLHIWANGAWFDAWEAHHFAGLYDRKRCGRPPKLTADEQEKAQHYLVQHPRDVRKVVHLLEQETSKRVSTKTIKRLVKKTESVHVKIDKNIS